MNTPIATDWIGVDWGTTNLRVWAMSHEGHVLAKNSSSDGMGKLERDAFESALLTLISGWLKPDFQTPVICCGMVGSRQGWVEAPYRSVPCKARADGPLVEAQVHDHRIKVYVIPGILQKYPADVMRGEETQIAGFLTKNPDYKGVICLPGTHTKWVQVDAGEIVKFTTFMTGELFALLSKNSVLRHCMQTKEWDERAFTEGVEKTFANPSEFTGQLFTLRAGSLISDSKPNEIRARLSGMLLGLELSAAREYWQGQNTIILGADALGDVYEQAVSIVGGGSTKIPVEELTLSGLCDVYSYLEATL